MSISKALAEFFFSRAYTFLDLIVLLEMITWGLGIVGFFTVWILWLWVSARLYRLYSRGYHHAEPPQE